MKVAPVYTALDERSDCQPLLLHTGQHYDRGMSELFFEELGMPEPDTNLDVHGGSHAQQTAEVMKRFEPALLELAPDTVAVVGDVNSTLACALVAVKAGVQVAHVEAGLRSFDRSMPEEINRTLTDAVSDLLFVTERAGLENLRKEGIADERVHFVGNVMIDTLLKHREKARQSDVMARLKVDQGGYALLTLHRPANVDAPGVLHDILSAIEEIQRTAPVVFPIHPRTRKSLSAFGMAQQAEALADLRIVEPLGYLDFLCLMDNAAVVLTDSGGIQEETTVLGVPCLTLRENTERPVTIEQGTNRLVGRSPERILSAFRRVMSASRSAAPTLPELWDGRASLRIADVLLEGEAEAGG